MESGMCRVVNSEANHEDQRHQHTGAQRQVTPAVSETQRNWTLNKVEQSYKQVNEI